MPDRNTPNILLKSAFNTYLIASFEDLKTKASQNFLMNLAIKNPIVSVSQGCLMTSFCWSSTGKYCTLDNKSPLNSESVLPDWPKRGSQSRSCILSKFCKTQATWSSFSSSNVVQVEYTRIPDGFRSSTAFRINFRWKVWNFPSLFMTKFRWRYGRFPSPLQGASKRILSKTPGLSWKNWRLSGDWSNWDVNSGLEESAQNASAISSRDQSLRWLWTW